MDLIRPGGNGCERICHRQASIVVAVPVHTDFLAAGLDDFFDDKFHQVVSAIRNGMANCVTQHDGAGATSNRSVIKSFHGLWVGTDRVFRYIHAREAFIDSELNGALRRALEMLHGPVFNEATNRARTKERGRLNSHAYTL